MMLKTYFKIKYYMYKVQKCFIRFKQHYFFENYCDSLSLFFLLAQKRKTRSYKYSYELWVLISVLILKRQQMNFFLFIFYFL